MQQFNEPAHMRSPVFMRQADIHVYGCHGGLIALPLIANRDGILQILDANLIYWNIAIVPLILYVLHFIHHMSGFAALGSCRLWFQHIIRSDMAHGPEYISFGLFISGIKLP